MGKGKAGAAAAGASGGGGGQGNAAAPDEAPAGVHGASAAEVPGASVAAPDGGVQPPGGQSEGQGNGAVSSVTTDQRLDQLTNMIAAMTQNINSRIETVTSQIATLTGKTETVNSQLAALTGRTETDQQKFQAELTKQLEVQAEQLKEQLAEQDAQLTGRLDNQVSTMGTTLTETKEKLTEKVTTMLTEHGTALTEHGTALNGRLQTLEDRITAGMAQLTTIKQDVKKTQQDITQVQAQQSLIQTSPPAPGSGTQPTSFESAGGTVSSPPNATDLLEEQDRGTPGTPSKSPSAERAEAVWAQAHQYRGLHRGPTKPVGSGVTSPASQAFLTIREEALKLEASPVPYARVDERTGQLDTLLKLSESQFRRRQQAGVPTKGTTGTGVTVLAPIDSAKVHEPPYLSSLDPASVRAFFTKILDFTEKVLLERTTHGAFLDLPVRLRPLCHQVLDALSVQLGHA